MPEYQTNQDMQLLDELAAMELADEPDHVPGGLELTVQKDKSWLGRHWRGALFAGALAAGAGGAVYAVQNDIVDIKQVDISSIGRGFIDAAEVGSPFILAAAGAQIGIMASTRPGRKNLQLAWNGLSPNTRGKLRNVAAGAMLPALGIGAVTNALMIEGAIHTGSNQNIISMDKNVTSKYPGTELIWNMQVGTHHFMNDSNISHATLDKVEGSIASQQYPGVLYAQPFYRDLVTIPTKYSDNQAGMVISVEAGQEPSPILPQVKPGANCELVDGRCNLRANEIIIDENEGFEIGDEVEIRGHKFNVVAFPKQDQSLVNRLIAFTGAETEHMEDYDYFGFVSLVNSKEDVTKMLEDLGLSNELEQETTQEFLDANNDFWYHNGTTLLFLLIADISLFSGATFAAVKNFEHERNLPVIATMKALGASKGQLSNQQHARSTMMTGKAIIPGAAGAAVATEIINKMLVGFHGRTELKMVGAAAGIVLLTQFGATAKLMRTINNKSEAEMMKAGS